MNFSSKFPNLGHDLHYILHSYIWYYVTSANKPFDVMTYLFGVTKHIKYVIPMMYTLNELFK